MATELAARPKTTSHSPINPNALKISQSLLRERANVEAKAAYLDKSIVLLSDDPRTNQ
jgi:hypothetical protein